MKLVQAINKFIYPKWKHKVPTFPTKDEFIEAFFELYEQREEKIKIILQ